MDEVCGALKETTHNLVKGVIVEDTDKQAEGYNEGVLKTLNEASWAYFIEGNGEDKFREPLNTLDCILVNFTLQELSLDENMSPILDTPDYVMNLKDLSASHVRHPSLKKKIILSGSNDRSRGSRSRKHDGQFMDIAKYKDKKF